MKTQDETLARPFALSTDIIIRTPAASDGAAVNELIERCKPLDENSVYCNLLQCSHFNDTCVLAEAEGEVVGFVSGYLLPKRDDRLFVWQVAVDERARGRSLAPPVSDSAGFSGIVPQGIAAGLARRPVPRLL